MFLCRPLTKKSRCSSTDNAPVHLCSSLQSALSNVSNPANCIHRAFIIGGASLYTESLALPSTDPGFSFVDRILLTRIISPAFEQCDVFMPDFLGLKEGKEESVGGWKKASYEELRSWFGCEVPEGVQEEKGVQYEYQMWVRSTHSDISS